MKVISSFLIRLGVYYNRSVERLFFLGGYDGVKQLCFAV